MTTATDLNDTIVAETAARDALVTAINAERDANRARRQAEIVLAAATRRRQQAFARASVRLRVPIQVLRNPPRDPTTVQRENREAVRRAAYAVLSARGVPMLAIELGPLIQIPARAVRNYLDGDRRFVIDHVATGKRDAVRVSLAS